jgi:hypothetical protein
MEEMVFAYSPPLITSHPGKIPHSASKISQHLQYNGHGVFPLKNVSPNVSWKTNFENHTKTSEEDK